MKSSENFRQLRIAMNIYEEEIFSLTKNKCIYHTTITVAPDSSMLQFYSELTNLSQTAS